MDKNFKINQIIESIERLVKLFDQFKYIFSFNHNALIANDLWDKTPHTQILNDMLLLAESELCQFTLIDFIKQKKNHCPKNNDLDSFITDINASMVPHVADVNDIEELSSNDSSTINFEYLSGLMSIKKQHEVKLISSICHQLACSNNINKVIDVGSGLGYFGCSLALKSGMRVVGVDSVVHLSKAAIKRKENLEKRIASHQKKFPSDISTNILYDTAECLIDESTDLKRIFEGASHEIVDSMMLTGLHTCGDLASNILRIFSTSDSIKILCSVGCCYNLLTEKNDKDCIIYGFPMSQFLKDKNFCLGHNARNIAAQSVFRSHDHIRSHNSIFWRCLLEVIIKDISRSLNLNSNHNREFKVGRLASKCCDFQQYVDLSLQKLNINCEVDALQYLQRYEKERHKCLCFYHLRAALGPVIENIILLDRYLYILKQETVHSAYLVKLFDPSISPRCYAIFALK